MIGVSFVERFKVRLDLKRVAKGLYPSELPDECRCIADGSGNWIIQLRPSSGSEWNLLETCNVTDPRH